MFLEVNQDDLMGLFKESGAKGENSLMGVFAVIVSNFLKQSSLNSSLERLCSDIYKMIPNTSLCAILKADGEQFRVVTSSSSGYQLSSISYPSLDSLLKRIKARFVVNDFQSMEIGKQYSLLLTTFEPIEPELHRLLKYTSLIASIHMNNIEKQSAVDSQKAKDPLTGVFTRQAGEVILNRELERAKRHKGVFSVVLVDIDDMKTINSRFGTSHGDKVLLSFASLVEELLRDEDIIVRWGGDEFLLILNESTLSSSRQIIKRIADSFDYEFSHAVVTCPEQAETSRKVIDYLSKALYRTKFMKRQFGKA